MWTVTAFFHAWQFLSVLELHSFNLLRVRLGYEEEKEVEEMKQHHPEQRFYNKYKTMRFLNDLQKCSMTVAKQ